MAYPNNIKSSGSLSQVNDLLEYFTGALREVPSWSPVTQDELITDPELNPARANKIPQTVHFFMNNKGNGSLTINSLPITREYLYEVFDTWVYQESLENNANIVISNYLSCHPSGMSLYHYHSPQSDWTVKMVNDWGKMKVIEYALFGNCGSDPERAYFDDTYGITYAGGLSDTTLPEFNGQTILASSVNWKKTKLSYLRCALIQFEDYGDYSNNEELEMLPITSINVDTSTRKITWVSPYPYKILGSWYEITYDGGLTWTIPSTREVTAPITGFEANKLGIRHREHNYYGFSEPLFSSASLPDISPINIRAEVYMQGPEYYCKLKTNHRMAVHYYVTARFRVNSYGVNTEVDVPLFLSSNSLESVPYYIGDEYSNRPFIGTLLSDTSNPSVGSLVSVVEGGTKELTLSSSIIFEIM